MCLSDIQARLLWSRKVHCPIHRTFHARLSYSVTSPLRDNCVSIRMDVVRRAPLGLEVGAERSVLKVRKASRVCEA